MTVLRFTHDNELDYAPCIAEYVMACLMMSRRDMAKMPSYIRDLIGSLRDSGAADAGNCLYNPSRYNPEITRITEGPGSYRKPEIEIHVAITKKGNLTVTWYPLHHFTSGILKTDSSHRVTNSSFHYFSEVGDNWNRPPNELLFLRSFEDHFRKIYRRSEPVEPSEANVSDVLVYASNVAIRSLVERLQCLFDVKIISNLFVEVTSEMPILRLASAVIMRTEDYEAERVKKLEQDEFDKFTQNFGLSVDQFLSIQQSLGSLTSTGRAFSPKAYPGQLKRALRAAGHSITDGKVSRALHLIEKFRFGPGTA